MQSRFKKIMFIYFAVIVICHCINKTDSENYDHEVDFIANDSYCYDCMTPEESLPTLKRNSVMKIIRYATKRLPEQKTENCSTNVTNGDVLQKQICADHFCFKYIVNDNSGKGIPFVIRMCAEQFINFNTSYVTEEEECASETKIWTTTGCFCRGRLCNL